MKSTGFDRFLTVRLPREVQLRRLRRVIREELTPIQRDTVYAHYYQGKSQAQIARERNVHRSTVCRTLRRAEGKLRSFLNY